MEQRPRVVRDIFTCVLLHNMLRTDQGGADRAPNPENDVAAIQNHFFLQICKIFLWVTCKVSQRSKVKWSDQKVKNTLPKY